MDNLGELETLSIDMKEQIAELGDDDLDNLVVALSKDIITNSGLNIEDFTNWLESRLIPLDD